MEHDSPRSGNVSLGSLGDSASNLVPVGGGVWSSRKTVSLSYPDQGYDQCFRLEEKSFWFRHRNDCIGAVVDSYPPSGTLLDVGGGNGFVTLHLQSKGVDAVLLEPAPQAVENAKSRGLRPIIHSTLEDAGFRPHSVPAIGLFDVLEHIEDDGAFLRAARELLASQGRLYLTVPAYGFLWSGDDEHAGHYRRYTLGRLSRTLRRAGFAIDYASYLFALLPPVILLLRTLPYRLGIHRGGNRRAREECARRDGIVSRTVRWTLRRELARIRRGKKLRLGSSCLVVARPRH